MSALTPGAHTFEVKARDLAVNQRISGSSQARLSNTFNNLRYCRSVVCQVAVAQRWHIIGAALRMPVGRPRARDAVPNSYRVALNFLGAEKISVGRTTEKLGGVPY